MLHLCLQSYINCCFYHLLCLTRSKNKKDQERLDGTGNIRSYGMQVEKRRITATIKSTIIWISKLIQKLIDSWIPDWWEYCKTDVGLDDDHHVNEVSISPPSLLEVNVNNDLNNLYNQKSIYQNQFLYSDWICLKLVNYRTSTEKKRNNDFFYWNIKLF